MIFMNENICIDTDIIDKLYFISINQYNTIATAYTATLKRETKLSIWHERYGHAVNSIIITLTISDNIKRLKILENPKQNAKNMNIYIDCAMKKIHRSSFPFINNIYIEKEIFIHFNTCESMQIISFNENKYLTIFINNTSRFTRDFLISDKKINIILEIFKIFKNLAKTKFIKHIQIIHTDNDIKYQNIFKNHLKDQDIEH